MLSIGHPWLIVLDDGDDRHSAARKTNALELIIAVTAG